jgi:hypothetical protein
MVTMVTLIINSCSVSPDWLPRRFTEFPFISFPLTGGIPFKTRHM